MPEAVHNDYEVSSPRGGRHWEVSYARLRDATPTPTNPADVQGTRGLELTGTILTVSAAHSIAEIDFSPGSIYNFYVRTVDTYGGGVEATYAAINEGTPIYYDDSATMAAGVYLSLSPLNNAGLANTLFGWAVLRNETDVYPKAAGAAGNTHWTAVMQRGCGS